MVYLNLNDFPPAITDEEFFPVEATPRCPGATGMCRVRLRVVPSVGGSRFAIGSGGGVGGGGAGGMRDPSGRMRKRRTSMFPSTAIKEGNMYIRVGSSGEWKSRHFVLTKEQLNFYEDSHSMKKLDQIHLLTPIGSDEGSSGVKRGKRKKKERDSSSGAGSGENERRRSSTNGDDASEVNLGLNDSKSCYLAMSWDYENAQRAAPTDKAIDVVQNFRPWHENVLEELEKKRLKTTVLSEKEKKTCLLMFRKICQASRLLPTLRIDLYAGDDLRRTCNPYVIFSIEGGSTSEEDGALIIRPIPPSFFVCSFIIDCDHCFGTPN